MPTKPTPRTIPVATGKIVLAAGAMLTLAACSRTAGTPQPTAGVPAPPPPPATRAAPPLAGDVAPAKTDWQPATQPTTLQSVDSMTTGGIIPEPRPNYSATQPAKTYTVKPGDTLTSIARAHKTTVAALKKANPRINPDKITPNQKLNLP